MSFPISDKGIPATTSQQPANAPDQQEGSLRGRKAKKSQAASASLTQALAPPSTSTAQQTARPFTRSVAKRMREEGGLLMK